MRIIVTGGGTGGHIFPALEIVKELKQQGSKIEILFVGNKKSLEEKMVLARHIPFYGLSTKKIVGIGFFKKFIALAYFALALLKSLWLLVRHRPNAVIGVGGYVSAPIICASFLLGIKRFICEQNVVPGLANRYLGKIAHKIFISFKESEKYFPKEKVVLSGNPVRQEFFSKASSRELDSLRILITGGSLGAHALNTEVPYVLKAFDPSLPVSITHQTGKAMFEEVATIYKKLGIKAHVISFIENMPEAFLEHNLLISRAGATVCAEIMASGMPAILIPYRFASGHQKENALALVGNGAALMVEEGEDFKEELLKALQSLHDAHSLEIMSNTSKTMAHPNAAFIIASNVLQEL